MRQELLQAIEQVGREKGIDRSVLIDAVGAAILSASRKTLGSSMDLRIRFDDQSGRFRLFSVKRVVETPVNPRTEISLPEAIGIDPNATVGGQVEMEVEPQTFGRIAAQTAKQVIIQRVREAERNGLYQSFKAREGELITGVVQRIVRGNIIVDLGKTEGLLPQREQLPNEEYRPKDRIRAYIVEVRKTTKGSQIVLSRTHPGFLIKLFVMEVPEIGEGIVEIRAAAREPGERAKIAVASKDPNVDPVGACVGFRGVRVQAIVKELQGEKIDIIPWKMNPAEFIIHALAPAEVAQVTVDEKGHTLNVVVPDDQLSLSIGKKGRNARLASKLVGWKVDIKSQSEIAKEVEKRKELRKKQLTLLLALPGVGEKMAEKLADLGFESLEKISVASPDALQKVKGIGEKSAEKLIAASVELLASERNKKEAGEPS
jgi:transcription termination/antitermination protein NusA